MEHYIELALPILSPHLEAPLHAPLEDILVSNKKMCKY